MLSSLGDYGEKASGFIRTLRSALLAAFDPFRDCIACEPAAQLQRGKAAAVMKARNRSDIHGHDAANLILGWPTGPPSFHLTATAQIESIAPDTWVPHTPLNHDRPATRLTRTFSSIPQLARHICTCPAEPIRPRGTQAPGKFTQRGIAAHPARSPFQDTLLILHPYNLRSSVYNGLLWSVEWLGVLLHWL